MDWITDRLPTEADADVYGDVVITTQHPGGWDMEKWNKVPESRPWLAFKSADAAKFLNDVAAAVAASAAQPRRIVSITRTVWMDEGGSQCHTIDAVADDGTAWWMVPGEIEWTQLPALPDRG